MNPVTAIPIGTLSGPPCKIPVNSSTCTTTLTLGITNPVSGADTNISDYQNVVVATGITPTQKTGIEISYPGEIFYLNHNAQKLANVYIDALCDGGTTWEDGICKIASVPGRCGDALDIPTATEPAVNDLCDR